MKQYSAELAARPAALSGVRPLQRLGVLLAGILMVAFALVVGSAGGASAHDELASSNPEPGVTLESVPEAVELTFSNVPATIGSQVQVLDESGEDWSEGDVSITDVVASQPIRDGAPAGTYTVNWRVVSSDSHAIEGTFEFTASGGTTASETPAASGTAAASETPAASAGTAGPIETGDPGALNQEPAGGSGLSWGVILMIAVLVALAVVLALGARRRLRQGDDDDG